MDYSNLASSAAQNKAMDNDSQIRDRRRDSLFDSDVESVVAEYPEGSPYSTPHSKPSGKTITGTASASSSSGGDSPKSGKRSREESSPEDDEDDEPSGKRRRTARKSLPSEFYYPSDSEEDEDNEGPQYSCYDFPGYIPLFEGETCIGLLPQHAAKTILDEKAACAGQLPIPLRSGKTILSYVPQYAAKTILDERARRLGKTVLGHITDAGSEDEEDEDSESTRPRLSGKSVLGYTPYILQCDAAGRPLYARKEPHLYVGGKMLGYNTDDSMDEEDEDEEDEDNESERPRSSGKSVPGYIPYILRPLSEKRLPGCVNGKPSYKRLFM